MTAKGQELSNGSVASTIYAFWLEQSGLNKVRAFCLGVIVISW